MASVEQRILAHLSDYLNGKIQLHEFEDNFVRILWDIDECPDARARELAGEIHVLTAEYSCGDRTLESLREELTRIANPSAGAPQGRQRKVVCYKVDRRNIAML